MSEMNRPPNRRRHRKGGPPRPPARRTPPSSHTGLETKFFEDCRRDAESLVVVLSDGRKISGVVREVDRELVTLAAESGEFVIRKSEIRYLYEG